GQAEPERPVPADDVALRLHRQHQQPQDRHRRRQDRDRQDEVAEPDPPLPRLGFAHVLLLGRRSNQREPRKTEAAAHASLLGPTRRRTAYARPATASTASTIVSPNAAPYPSS